jgi:hypothetical protein
MDYKLRLDECDAVAIVGLAGGRDFKERQANALKSPLLAPSARTWWVEAQNDGLATDEVAVTLNGSSATVELTARPIGLPWHRLTRKRSRQARSESSAGDQQCSDDAQRNVGFLKIACS